MPNMLAEIVAHKVAEIENLKLRKPLLPMVSSKAGVEESLPARGAQTEAGNRNQSASENPESFDFAARRSATTGGAGVPPASIPDGHKSGHSEDRASLCDAEMPSTGLDASYASRLQYSKTQDEKHYFIQALAGSGLKIVAEIKPASPSAGVLRQHVDLDDIVRVYDCQASAISVLTDGKYFASSFSVLEQVAKRSVLPVLCKDFIIDPYQVHSARISGAHAVLLIVKLLSDAQLSELSQLIEQLGMTPVIEVQSRLELSRALQMKPEVLLINNRNLDTFEIDLSTTLQLAPLVPAGVMTISASGITCRADIGKLRPVCSRFLIGSALMLSPDIEGKLKELATE